MFSMKRFLTLLKIEGRLALRSIDGVFFGIIMPMGIAILIGMISGNKNVSDGADYTFIDASFGALITIGICATALMGIPLGISDYRDKKILKHYFVTPVSPVIILMVYAVINFLNAVISCIGVYLVLKVFYGFKMLGSLGGFLLSYMLVLIAMYGIGMLIASLCKNIKTANLVCTLVYFPMLFLSGATIPYEILPKPLQQVSNVLPLTQGIKLLKGFSLGLKQENLIMPIVVLVLVAFITIILSFKYFKWE